MKTVTLKTHLKAAPKKVWDALNTPHLLVHVARPMMRFQPVKPDHLPALWAEGDYVVRLWFYGVLPLGKQTISISWPAPDGPVRFIRDNGHSALIRRWDHLISVAPDGDGTLYTDKVEIEAGVLTPIVTAFARRFYAHRQARWRQLVAADFKEMQDT